jgi:phosphate transport system protein
VHRQGYGALVATSDFRKPHEFRKHFDQELAEIDGKVIRLFALVTEAVSAATESFLSGDRAVAQATLDRDAAVDQLERDLEDLAQRELVRQSPLASDMRYLLTVIRVVPELERSGDLAEHIAQRAVLGLAGRLTPGIRGLIEEMGGTCITMWKAAADAWAERDPGAAARIDADDDRIDLLHDRLIEELCEADVELADALQTTLVARFYERLGDHAVHISERVTYLVLGKRDSEEA